MEAFMLTRATTEWDMVAPAGQPRTFCCLVPIPPPAAVPHGLTHHPSPQYLGNHMRMKTLLPILVLSSTAVLLAQAQAGQPVATVPAALAPAAAAPSSGAVYAATGADSAFSIVARAANHRLW